MKVISIGYGRQLFEEKNLERERLEICAKEVDSLEMIIFTLKSEGYEKTQVTEGFVLYPTNSRNRFTMLLDAYQIAKKLLKNTKIKVVLSTQDPFEIGLLGWWLSKQKNVVLQVQEHADVYSNLAWRNESVINFFRYYVGIFVLKKADFIRVVSMRTQRTFSEKFGLKDKVRLLPVAIRVDAREDSNINSAVETDGQKNFVFLSVGRFVAQKNFPLMIRAFKKVWKKNKNVRLHIVGRGPEEEKIKHLILELFKSETSDTPVTISDWSDDVPSLMRNAQAYLLTSNYEGWARVLVESILCKLPIVTTDVGCAGEVVIDGTHGKIVPVYDENALIDAMNTVVNDTQLYKKIKQNLNELKIEDISGTDFKHYGVNWVSSLS